jgi:hypothetical protein
MITETELQELQRTLNKTQELPVLSQKERARLTLKLLREHTQALKLFWESPELRVDGTKGSLSLAQKLVSALEKLTGEVTLQLETDEVTQISGVWETAPDIQSHFSYKEPSEEEKLRKAHLQFMKGLAKTETPPQTTTPKKEKEVVVEATENQEATARRTIIPSNWEAYLKYYAPDYDGITRDLASGAILIGRPKNRTPVSKSEFEDFQRAVEEVLPEEEVDNSVDLGEITKIRETARSVSPESTDLLLGDEYAIPVWGEALSHYFKTQKLSFKGCWKQLREGRTVTTALWDWPVPESNPVRNNEIQISTWTENPIGELSAGHVIQAWLFLRRAPGELMDYKAISKNYTDAQLRKVHQDPGAWLRAQKLDQF